LGRGNWNVKEGTPPREEEGGTSTRETEEFSREKGGVRRNKYRAGGGKGVLYYFPAGGPE